MLIQANVDGQNFDMEKYQNEQNVDIDIDGLGMYLDYSLSFLTLG